MTAKGQKWQDLTRLSFFQIAAEIIVQREMPATGTPARERLNANYQFNAELAAAAFLL